MNSLCKLTPAQAGELRRAYATGRYSFRSLGRKYGVSGCTAHDIVKGKVYGRYMDLQLGVPFVPLDKSDNLASPGDAQRWDRFVRQWFANATEAA